MKPTDQGEALLRPAIGAASCRATECLALAQTPERQDDADNQPPGHQYEMHDRNREGYDSDSEPCNQPQRGPLEAVRRVEFGDLDVGGLRSGSGPPKR